MPDADVGAGWGETVGRGPGGPARLQGDGDRRHHHRADRDRARSTRSPADRGPDLLGQGRAAAGGQHHRIRLHRRRRQEGRRSRQDTAWAERARRPLRRGLRGYRPDPKQAGYKLVQLSINAPDKYIGTIALADNGELRRRRRSMARRRPLAIFAGFGARATSRRISGFSTRSTAPLPATTFRARVTGEAIMLVSKVFDLSALATKDDRLTIVFAKTAATVRAMPATCSTSPIHGGDRNFECFVYQPTPGAPYACMTEKDATHSLDGDQRHGPRRSTAFSPRPSASASTRSSASCGCTRASTGRRRSGRRSWPLSTARSPISATARATAT